MIGTWIVVALFAGLILILTNELAYGKPERIEYRYLPRDLDTYIREAPAPSTVFGSMFTDQDVVRGGQV